MTKEDVKDTMECRSAMISYIEYLEKGGEHLDNEFVIFVADKILSKAALIALKKVLEKVSEKLSVDVDNKHKTVEQAEVSFNEARDKALKHCLILEIKHNVSKTSDIAKLKKNPKHMELESTIEMLLKKHHIKK